MTCMCKSIVELICTHCTRSYMDCIVQLYNHVTNHYITLMHSSLYALTQKHNVQHLKLDWQKTFKPTRTMIPCDRMHLRHTYLKSQCKRERSDVMKTLMTVFCTLVSCDKHMNTRKQHLESVSNSTHYIWRIMMYGGTNSSGVHWYWRQWLKTE